MLSILHGVHHDPIWRESDWRTLSDSSLILLNDGSSTRISANPNHISVPDISIISSDLAGTIGWEVMDDARGSDHLPISLVLKTVNDMNLNDQGSRPRLLLKNFNKDAF